MKRRRLVTYKRLTVSLMCLVCVASGIATASFSFSWFSNKNNVTRNINGYTAGAYFAGGSGKESDPYIIKNPIHLYNLAWLYYIGYFKGEEPYFSISSDLNMSGWTLPPIGTSTNPFNGHLNGNGKKINGLTITNDFDKLKNKKPSMVTEADWNGSNTKYGPTPNILGLFGYVSKESKGIPSIENVYINNGTVNSITSTALVGIAAGYVDGKLDSIYIDNSFVNIKDETSSVGTLNDETISNVSEYTSVGYCTEDYRTKYTRYETTLYEPCYVASTSKDTYKKGGQGQEQGFGGSIDMLTLNRRVSYINSSGKSSSYNVAFGTSSSKYNWLSSSTYIDLSSGSYLPINIDLESTTLNDVSGANDTSNSYYSSHSNEPILETNSGYITGGNARVRAQASNKDNQGIKYAVKRVNGTTTESNSAFDLFTDTNVISLDKLKSNIGILTYSFSENDIAAIYDDDNKDFVQSSSFVYKTKAADVKNKKYVNSSSLSKYSSVKNNLLQMFYDSTNAYYSNGGTTASAVYLPAFRFQKWDTDTTFTKNVEWLGENKTITFHNNGVQFELAQDGYITAIVSKYDSTGNFVFYNLYSVDLNNNSALTKINTIHKDSKGTISYNDSDSSTKFFDFSPLLTTDTGMYAYQLFYFEVPIKKGSYFLSTYGSTYAASSYPYLLYLDIGANAGDDGSSGETVTRTKVFEFLEQITQAFTYPTGVYIADFDNAVLDTKTLAITLGTKYSGEAKITRTNNNADVIVNSDANTNTGVSYYDLDFIVTNDGSTIDDSDILSVEKTVTQTKRMTYYDYDTDDSTLRMFKFSQTKEGDGEYSSVTAETQYLATYSDSTLSSWTETSGQTVYNDDGTSTSETKGIPSPIATDGITIPDDLSTSTNVFSLTLKPSKKDDFSNTYLSSVDFDADTHKTTIDGYLFTIINESKVISSSDYNIVRNSKYSLQINDDTYAKA